ncbi:MAG: L,D-transpeptidase [Kastovskya adunca ATA6-11-RM4]|jgi:lipoprotein-anchoring transpeptidase ErfK/SrfK|nr:L,D-transpeptidase [Kastovskya adunca ATA6-11-RM4]
MASNDSLSHSFMLMSFGAAGVLFFMAVQPKPAQQSSEPKTVVAALPTPPQSSSRKTSASTVSKASLLTPYMKWAAASLTTRLVVDLSDAQVYLYWGDQQLASYPVAVGQPGWETPTGTFKVIHQQRNPVWQQPITGELIKNSPKNPLGDRWIGFWSDGRHQIGFHGTNQEALVGQAVSHGCLRMRNQDIRALYEQVSPGTPVIVKE